MESKAVAVIAGHLSRSVRVRTYDATSVPATETSSQLPGEKIRAQEFEEECLIGRAGHRVVAVNAVLPENVVNVTQSQEPRLVEEAVLISDCRVLGASQVVNHHASIGKEDAG